MAHKWGHTQDSGWFLLYLEGHLHSGRKFKSVLWLETSSKYSFMGILGEGKEKLIPDLPPCGRIFLLPPKPQISPLCHLLMNVRLRLKESEEFCFVSSESAKRLTGSKGIKNIWKHGLCIFLSPSRLDCVWMLSIGERTTEFTFTSESPGPLWFKQVNGLRLVTSLLAALGAQMVTASVVSFQIFPSLCSMWKGK